MPVKRIIYRCILIVIALALTSAIGLALIAKTVNPELYKDEISTLIEQKVGYPVLFDGQLKVDIFPTLGITTGRMRVASDTLTFGQDPLLQIENLTLQLKLWPLLKKQVVVTALRLQGVRINLVQTTVNEKNWLPHKKKTEEKKTNEQAIASLEQPKKEKTQPSKKLTLNAIDLAEAKDIEINYIDNANQKHYYMAIDAFSLKNFMQDATTTLHLAGYFEEKTSSYEIEMQIQGTIVPKSQSKFVIAVETLASQAGKGTTSGNASPGLGIEARLKAEIDLAEYTFNAHEFSGKIADFPFTGHVNMQIAPNKSLPEGIQTALQGKMHINTINIDNLIQAFRVPVAEPMPEVKEQAVLTTQLRLQQKSKNKKPEKPPFTKALQNMTADFTLTATHVAWRQITINNLSTPFTLNNGMAKLTPVCKVNDAPLSGTITLKTNTKKPEWQVDIKGEDLPLQAFLPPQKGVDAITGNITTATSLTAVGVKKEEILQSLKGKGTVAIKKMVTDLTQKLPEEVKILLNVPEKTIFESITATFTLDKGKATTNNLVFTGNILAGEGKGSANYLNQTLDANLNVTPLLQPLAVPLHISGPWQKPKVKMTALPQGLPDAKFIKNLFKKLR